MSHSDNHSITGERQDNLRDPGKVRWVRFTALAFVVLMPPVWPLPGLVFGIPLWAVWAVGVSAALGLFTCYVLFRVWRDPEEDAPETRPTQSNPHE